MRGRSIAKVVLPCRFTAVRDLGDAYPDRQRAAQMMELELVRSGIDADLGHLHVQWWAVRADLLWQILMDAPGAEKVAAPRAGRLF